MSRLLAHLGRQLDSSRRLLQIVLSQNEAIRRQDVDTLLSSLRDVEAEMALRRRLEDERDELVREATLRLAADPDELDLDSLLAFWPAPEAEQARMLSAELRGLLLETGRLHDQNRVLIRQELAFLDLLVRAFAGTPQGGYSPHGFTVVPQNMNVVNARA
jgi:hypothetical protein